MAPQHTSSPVQRFGPEQLRPILLAALFLLSSFSLLSTAARTYPKVTSADGDQDGLTAVIESRFSSLTAPSFPLSDSDPDSDNDGLPDGWEYYWGLNPWDSTGSHGASGDPDNDGLSNIDEYRYNSLRPGGAQMEVDDRSSVTYGGVTGNGNGKLDHGVNWNGTAPTNQVDESKNMVKKRPSPSWVDNDPWGDADQDGNIDDDGDWSSLTDDLGEDGIANTFDSGESNGFPDAGEPNVDEDVAGWDTDGDGMDDKWEINAGLNPIDPFGINGSLGDPDSDRLSNIEEYMNPVWSTAQYTSGYPQNSSRTWPKYNGTDAPQFCKPWPVNFGGNGCSDSKAQVDLLTRTDPLDPDNDNDNLIDGAEVENGTDPTANDTDGDGVDDYIELTGQYGPGRDTPSNPIHPDSDEDGLKDGEEDLNADGIIDSGETDPMWVEDNNDSDKDGLPNWYENRTAKNHSCTLDWLNPDSDGGGRFDGWEENTTGYDPCDSIINWTVQIVTKTNQGGGVWRLELNTTVLVNPYEDQYGGGVAKTPNNISIPYNPMTPSLKALSSIDVTVDPGSATELYFTNNTWCWYESRPGRSLSAYSSYCDDDYKDSDGDRLSDFQEIVHSTNISDADSDFDGESDFWEVMNGTQAYNTLLGGTTWDNDGYCVNSIDSDFDGLTDSFEESIGCLLVSQGITEQGLPMKDLYVTNATNPDTDSGGVDDNTEYRDITDPTDPRDDILPPDFDNDGIPDSVEQNYTGTDWRDPDTDDGGMLDGEECPMSSWIPGMTPGDCPPQDPFDPSDDSNALNTLLFYANTSQAYALADSISEAHWVLERRGFYTGASYAVDPSMLVSVDATSLRNETEIFDGTISTSDDVYTWQLEYAIPILSAELAHPWGTELISSIIDGAADVEREHFLGGLDVNGTTAAVTRLNVESQAFTPSLARLQQTDPYSTADPAGKAWNDAFLLLPNSLTDMTNPNSTVKNTTDAVLAAANGGLGFTDAYQQAKTLANWLKSDSNPRFTLNSSGAGQNTTLNIDIVAYLFDVNRNGTCEDYATAFVTMSRLAGIPSRMVRGYRGGIETSAGNWEIYSNNHTYWGEVHLMGDGTAGVGTKDFGWVPMDPCPSPDPIEVTNLNLNVVNISRDGTIDLDVQGKLMFQGTSDPVADTDIELWLVPSASAGDPDHRNVSNKIQAKLTTAADGSFQFTGLPSSMIAAGEAKLILVNSANGRAFEQVHVLAPLLNVTSNTTLVLASPSSTTPVPVAADDTTQLIVQVSWAEGPFYNLNETTQLPLTLRFESSDLLAAPSGWIEVLSSTVTDGFATFNVAISANEGAGLKNAYITHSGWHAQSTPGAYHILPLNYSFEFDIRQGPSLIITSLEGPGTDNSVIEVGSHFYINGTAKTKGTPPTDLNGTIDIHVRTNGTDPFGGVPAHSFQVTNGVIQGVILLDATLAQQFPGAGSIDFKLIFRTNDPADPTNETELTKTLVGALAISANVAGGCTSIKHARGDPVTCATVTVVDHRGVLVEPAVGWFNTSYATNTTWVHAQPGTGLTTGQYDPNWLLASDWLPGVYAVNVTYNKTTLYLASQGQFDLVVSGDFVVNYSIERDWTNQSESVWINGTVNDSVYGQPVQTPQTITISATFPATTGSVSGSVFSSNGTFFLELVMPVDQAGVYDFELETEVTDTPYDLYDGTIDNDVIGLIGNVKLVANKTRIVHRNGDQISLEVRNTDPLTNQPNPSEPLTIQITRDSDSLILSHIPLDLSAWTGSESGFAWINTTLDVNAQPGNYTIEIICADNTAGIVNHGANAGDPSNADQRRLWGSNTTVELMVQVDSTVIIDSIDHDPVTALTTFVATGKVVRSSDGTTPVGSSVDLRAYFQDNPGTEIGTGSADPSGFYNLTLTATGPGGAISSGAKVLAIEVVENDNIPFLPDQNGTLVVNVRGVSDFVNPSVNPAVILTRGSVVNLSVTLVESSDSNQAVIGGEIGIRLGNSHWLTVPANVTGLGGVYTIEVLVPMDVPLGPTTIWMMYNGSATLLPTFYNFTSIKVQDGVEIIFERIESPVIAGGRMTIEGRIISNNGSMPAIANGTPIEMQLSVEVDNNSVAIINGSLFGNDGDRFNLTITLPNDLKNGTHWISVTTPAVTNYLTTQTNGTTFQNRGYTTIAFLDPLDGGVHRYVRGQNISVNITLRDNAGDPLSDVQVNVSLADGEEMVLNGTTDLSGRVSITIPLPNVTKAGSLTIMTWWNGSNGADGLDGSQGTTTVLVLVPTSIQLDPMPTLAIANESVTISGHIFDEHGNLLLDAEDSHNQSDALLHLWIDGVDTGLVARSNSSTGAFSFDYLIPLDTQPGPITVDVRFLGGYIHETPYSSGDIDNPEYHLKSNASDVFDVHIRTFLSITSESASVDRGDFFYANGTLVDEFGRQIAGATLQIYLGDTNPGDLIDTTTTDASGNFAFQSVVSSTQQLGDARLIIIYLQNGYHLGSQDENNWTIFSPVALTADGPSQALAIGESLRLVGTVGDNVGQPIQSYWAGPSNYTLEVHFAGVTKTIDVSDRNWSIDLVIPEGMASGTHIAFINATQQGWYRAASVSVQVIVAHKTEITFNLDSADIDRGQWWHITGTLRDLDAANSPLENRPLVVRLDGELIIPVDSTGFVINNPETGGNGTIDLWVRTTQLTTRGEHVLTVEHLGNVTLLATHSNMTGIVWAYVSFDDIESINPQVVRSDPGAPLRVTGRISEVGGNESPISDVPIRLESWGLALDSIDNATWLADRFSIVAIAPEWIAMNSTYLAYELHFAGDASQYLRPANYTVKPQECEDSGISGSVSRGDCTFIQFKVDYQIIVEKVVHASTNPEEMTIRGRVILTANDTGEPISGFELIVRLSNESTVEPWNITKTYATDAAGSASFLFGETASPPYSHPMYDLRLSIDSEDQRIAKTSRFFLDAAGRNSPVVVESPPPETHPERWAAAAVIVLGVIGYAAARILKKRRSNVASELGDIMSYTAELLASGDDIREAIFNCYEQMCIVLMRHRFLRRDFETVREFELAIRKALPIKEDSLIALDRMFEEARYSKHEMLRSDFEQARSSLKDVVDEIDGMDAGGVPSR